MSKTKKLFRPPQLPSSIKWLWPYIKPYRVRLLMGLFLNMAVTLMSLVNPIIGGLIVANVLQGSQKELLPVYLIIMVCNTLLRAIIRYVQLIIYESASQNVVRTLRKDLYERVLAQTFNFHDENRVGDTMSRMTGDLEAIRGFVGYDAYAIPEAVLLFLSAIIMMFVLSFPLAASILLVVPVVLFAAYRQNNEIKPAFRNVREQFSRLNSVCGENIGGNRVVKAFAREQQEVDKFTQANEAFYESNTRVALIWAKYMPVMETCAGVMPLAPLLLGSLLIIWGHLELWQLITFNGYLWMVNMPTRMFGMHVNNTQNFITSLDKITEMMHKKIYIKDPASTISIDINGTVEFKQVNFGYDRNDPKQRVLKDINFRAEAGQTIGIVGPTGSGKTTLVQLIGRFHDVASGAVEVDGINVKDYPLPILRKGIAAAMQDVFLFSDTIEGNIAYGDPDMALETVFSSARAADVDNFVRSMPDGYDTIVGERGVGLSGGQKQRLSLARALAVEPSILILDDTTSAVDMETERRIQEALEKLCTRKLRTIFIIAHRLLSVKDADLILVLQNGEITERGTHDTLMELGGYYATLFAEQQGIFSVGSASQNPALPPDFFPVSQEGGDFHGA